MRTSAEVMLDLRVGGSFSSKSETTRQLIVETWDPFPTYYSEEGTLETEWKDSVGGGIRGGYWFEGLAKWLGLAGDASFFRLKEDVSGEAAEIDVIPFSLLLMFRAPLITSKNYPNGRLQPYVAAGPSFFFSDFSRDLDPDREFYDLSLDVGADVRGGLTFLVSKHFGFFAEYRFTHFDVEYHDTVSWDFFDDEMGGTEHELDFDTRLQTHHVAGGVTFRF